MDYEQIEEGRERDVLDVPAAPGFSELDLSWQLLGALRHLKTSDSWRGREWVIAATEAEKLHAWIGYVVGMMPEEVPADGAMGT